jgi:hypothetical protein
MPPPELSPFTDQASILGGHLDLTDNKPVYTQQDSSLMHASTDFPTSDLLTSRLQPQLPKLLKDSSPNLNLDLTAFGATQQP